MNAKSVGVIGAGAWGTAVAQALARGGNKVEIWAREQDVVDSINQEHENIRFLPKFKLSENLSASTDILKVAQDKEFLILASPSLYFVIPTGTTAILFTLSPKDCKSYNDFSRCLPSFIPGHITS